MFCGSRGSKSRLAQAARAEPFVQMIYEKLRAVVARSRFGSQKAKKQLTSGAVLGAQIFQKFTSLWTRVARSTFRSQRCEKLMVSGHFWKLRCSEMFKSARRCGAKHSVKMLKHFSAGEVLEVHALVARSAFQREKFSVQN